MKKTVNILFILKYVTRTRRYFLTDDGNMWKICTTRPPAQSSRRRPLEKGVYVVRRNCRPSAKDIHRSRF